MRFISRNAFVAPVAVFAMSVAGVSMAQAEGGPVWITHNGVLPKKVVSAGSTGVFRVVSTSNVEVTCQKEAYTGEIAGTNPGTGKGTFTFSGCKANEIGTPNCIATGKKEQSGVITLGVKTVLMYAQPGVNSTKADEAFFPESEANVLAEITLTAGLGGTCGLFEGRAFVAKATGPEVKEPAVDRKCGFLAEIGKDNGSSFERTVSGALNESGVLNFPVPAAESAVVWQEKAKTFKTVDCEMTSGLGEVGYMSGAAMVNTESIEPFGWEV